jgi:uncharacterized protein (TIGR02757 family)
VAFPRRFQDPADVEAAAFIAATFAFGRVAQILGFLESLFAELSPSPHAALTGSRPVPRRMVAHLRYRFVSPEGVHRLLLCLRAAYRAKGSLEVLYAEGTVPGASARERLSRLLAWFRRAWGPGLSRQRDFLFPDPGRGSACKRHNLFLRWMVRRGDGVDLGLWTVVSPADLIVPLDTHMSRMGKALGLTARRAADWKAAEEVTAAFRAVCPEDPVKFDFALTRLGILRECMPRHRGACHGCFLLPACLQGRGREK